VDLSFSPAAQETGCARRSEIFDLRADFWIANINPSNPRFKEVQINRHSLTALRCLEFITEDLYVVARVPAC
jgi:hypothetical protein